MSHPAEIVSPTITATLAPKLSLALHQNAIPVLRELAVANEGEQPLEAVELALTSDPPFVRPKIWRVDRSGPQQRYHFTDLDIALDGPLLSRLTEAEVTRVTFALKIGADEIARFEQPIELLARNQWGGIGHVPELVAAFVQPNDPAVDRILKKAAEILRRNDKEPALDGYRSGKRQRAWELI
jgi:hypothetical protein